MKHLIFLDITLDSDALSSLLNALVKVALISFIIALPFLIATLVLYLYRRYKRWSETEDKKLDLIILGKAKEITKYDEDLKWKQEEIRKAEDDLDILRNRKKRYQEELGIIEDESEPGEVTPKEQIDISSMTIRKLKALAKELKVPMFSRLNKEQLINKLQNINIPCELLKKVALREDKK